MHNDYLYSMMKVSSQLPGMTPSETKKPPKLGFSIDSLVGGQRPASRDPDDNQGPPSPLSLASVFPGSLLSKPDKVPIIQRPQPINGAIHRPSSDAALLLSNALNIPKGIGAPLSHHLVPPSLGFNPLANIPGIPLHTQLNPLLMGAGVPPLGPPVQRDYPLYPWLLSRHNRVFPQGLPSPEHLAYLLHPFRKPKRIRTAFSPNQLLKLEQAFEKNQYVVGTERKQLAHTLNLSETQVKVWFQNRRTKEKRSNTDGETPPGCKIGIDEDEEIDDDDIEEEVEERRKKELERLKDMSYDMPTTSVDKKYPESTSTYSFPDLPTTSTPLSASLSTSVSLSSLRNESSSPVPVNTTAPCDFPRSDSIKMESTCVSTS